MNEMFAGRLDEALLFLCMLDEGGVPPHIVVPFTIYCLEEAES